MKLWVTEIEAIDPETQEMKTWLGPYIKATSWENAQTYCKQNGLGYCRVTGQLISEIPCGTDLEPKWMAKIDFDNLN